ncbi:MAG TPA: CoA transferase, partial [Acidimicrobiales bacterium]|nr:CoA transferase [Acidimicrobiales bacterium]
VDYESVRRRNPEVVYCNTYAYGAEGPMSEFGGLDPLYQAACGLEHEAGPVPEGNPPLYLRFGMADTANAFASVVGVLAALLHRRRTGRGQQLWTSLLNAAALLSSDVFLVDGRPAPGRPGLDRAQTGTGPGYRLYEGRDGWIQVAAVTPEQRDALAAVAGSSRDDGDAGGAVEELFARRSVHELQSALDRVGVPAEISIDTNDGDLVLNDADNERLGLVASYPHPLVGLVRQFGALIGFSETPTGPYGPPPLLGQHTREVMHDLGYADDVIDDLVARGVVYEPDDRYPFTH